MDLPPPDSLQTLTLRDGARLRVGRWLPALPDGTRPADPKRTAGTVLLLPGRSEPLEKYGEAAARLASLTLTGTGPGHNVPAPGGGHAVPAPGGGHTVLVPGGGHTVPAPGGGHTVLVPDWRGQGLSDGRPAPGSQVGHAEDFDLFADDLAELLTLAPSQPVTIVAHSMGGAIALRYLQRTPVPPAILRRVVVLGPMITLPDHTVPHWLAAAVAEVACLLGRGQHYAAGQGDWGPDDRTFDGNRRTSDPARFAREVALLSNRPELRLGGPSWGWVRAAYRLSARLRKGFDAGVPLLILQGEDDPYVPLADLRAFQARVSNSRLHLLPGCRHEPLMELDSAQALLWSILSDVLN